MRLIKSFCNLACLVAVVSASGLCFAETAGPCRISVDGIQCSQALLGLSPSVIYAFSPLPSEPKLINTPISNISFNPPEVACQSYFQSFSDGRPLTGSLNRFQQPIPPMTGYGCLAVSQTTMSFAASTVPAIADFLRHDVLKGINNVFNNALFRSPDASAIQEVNALTNNLVARFLVLAPGQRAGILNLGALQRAMNELLLADYKNLVLSTEGRGAAERFFNTLYEDALDRAPDQGGLGFWMGDAMRKQIAEGKVTYTSVVKQFCTTFRATEGLPPVNQDPNPKALKLCTPGQGGVSLP